MIKKFNEFIEEGFLSKTINRSKSGELRKEQGRRVKTPTGVEIVLENPDYNYEELMRWILDGEDGIGVDLDNIGNYPIGDQKDIKKGTCEYSHMINNRIVASFESYEDLIEDGRWFDEGEVTRNDYISVIEGIVNSLKQTELDRKKGNGYDSETVFLLIDESTVYHYECESNESTLEYYFEDFQSCFEDHFPDIELEFWSYNNYASNIGMRVDYDNLLIYKDAKEWVQNYFESLKETYEENEE